MKNTNIHKLRVIVGYALIGSVLTGALLSWIPIPFDLRIIGASVGALAGTVSSHWA
ncbi:hypothetical protein ACO0LB_10175 [Undibacterium sp. SXout7W]|uniref:hypothetical protein n=1 Tax=Undibacterium sp. SXout7W TaxID=3413049 RepID=UPI003BF420A4